MIALDTNILIAALVKNAVNHKIVAVWIEKEIEALAVTATNTAEFLRLVTHPKVFSAPLTLLKAIDLLDSFVTDFSVTQLEEDIFWWKKVPSELQGIRGNEIFDLRIANCLLFNGVKRICTFDTDFLKYRTLEVIVPA